MKLSKESIRLVTLAGSACLALVLAAAASAACSSSSTPSSSSGGTSGTSGTSGGPAAGCTSNDLKIAFSPMYTGFDGTHDFKVPAVAKDVKASDVTWSASDMSMVTLAPFSDSSATGIMITPTKAGQVTIMANANGKCGTSLLTITAAKEADDWHDGALRYNDGVDLRPAAGADAGGGDGGANKTAACTNCHGATANSAFKDVSHTPEQIGGFSDDDLQQIIRQGVVPAGGYFDTTITTMEQWHSFHQWQMTDEELRGLLVYLRSLPPTPQAGKANFGGSLGP